MSTKNGISKWKTMLLLHACARVRYFYIKAIHKYSSSMYDCFLPLYGARTVAVGIVGLKFKTNSSGARPISRITDSSPPGQFPSRYLSYRRQFRNRLFVTR